MTRNRLRKIVDRVRWLIPAAKLSDLKQTTWKILLFDNHGSNNQLVKVAGVLAKILDFEERSENYSRYPRYFSKTWDGELYVVEKLELEAVKSYILRMKTEEVGLGDSKAYLLIELETLFPLLVEKKDWERILKENGIKLNLIKVKHRTMEKTIIDIIEKMLKMVDAARS